jgi:hypothetical protein
MLFIKSFAHLVHEITLAKQKDHSAPERKKMSGIQNNVLKVQTLQNMHGLLIM